MGLEKANSRRAVLAQAGGAPLIIPAANCYSQQVTGGPAGQSIPHMTNAPTVSIGLPVYNGEKYLDGCLRNLLEQSFQDYEIIISDNG